jgi:hypothetical protein
MHQATQVTSPLPVPPAAGGAGFARAPGAEGEAAAAHRSADGDA